MKQNKNLRQKFSAKTWGLLLKDSENLFKRGDIVLAAVSGGADSACLLHFLNFISQKQRFSLYACHINHNLRDTALRDEKFTKKLCKEYGVKCFTVSADVKKIAKDKNLSIEHAARRARYDAFEQISAKVKANFIAMAHHADDNAETMILNLLRSPHAKGLLGIPNKRPLNNSTMIVRPFLNITRQDVLNYAKFNDISFVEDETNADNNYTRNWVRNELLPLIAKKQPKIREHLVNISKELQGVLTDDKL
ncbi:tRNA(Ile)-lysidine synthase [Elusimicrobium posterum]|uniref:tRNA lysidine(34) synthetase TilS n=1 Tax=Elusimicrobium posterum TaxID=3116653 RepID=UPI003C737F35